MVARILGKLLHMAGILPTDKVIEVQRTDLVGEFVGHTGPKTRRKVSLSARQFEGNCDTNFELDLLTCYILPNSLLPHLNRYRMQKEVFFLWTKLTG